MGKLDVKIKDLEEEVSKERKKLSSDRMDISFGELISLYKNEELIIRPEYQRLFRWSAKQKTALIESIILAIPIPPIFVSEDKDGVWELVDGLQRVSTFISFFGDLSKSVTEILYRSVNEEEFEESSEEGSSAQTLTIGNKWSLEAGGLVKNLEGFNIDTLPPNLKINLKRAVCRVEILRGESSTAMKYELFKRLNSGGSKLTPQEIRNAIYRGINPKLNELTLELSQNGFFKKLTDLSEMKKQELYDQELVLRFIAFLNNTENVNENTENFLNKFMEDSVKNEAFDFEMYRNIFIKVLTLIDSIDNDKIFRNNRNLFVPAEFEGITIAVAQNIDTYENNIELLKTNIAVLKSDEKFRQLSGSSSNSKSRIKNRLHRANEIFKVTP